MAVSDYEWCEAVGKVALQVLPAITRIQQRQGITSASGIAKALNDQGTTTPRGGQWQAVQVQRIISRAS